MNILIKNTIVRLTGHHDSKRILYISSISDLVVSISMCGHRCAPNLSSYNEWLSMLDRGDMEIMEDSNLDLPFNHSLSDAMRSRKERAWDAIEPLIKDMPSIFQPSYRNVQITKRAAEVQCHVDSIRDWLCEYWQMGSTPAALFGKRNRCGAPGKTKPVNLKSNTTVGHDVAQEVKRGAPRTKTSGIGTNMSEEHRRTIQVATNLFYKKNRKATLKYTYLKMLRHFYRDSIAASADERMTITNPENIPTYQQFLYWHKKENEEYDLIRLRKGQIFFEKTLRPLLGNSTFEAIGPGYRYQIDATIADIYLVSRIDRNTIVGRPVMYVVIDVWSRLIVGLYIGLEEASWTTAMMAIHNVTLNKVDFCRQFDISIDPSEWPNTPLATVLLGDRGELLSQQADRLTEILGIEIENTPPYRADWKGIVERQFRLLPAKFSADVSGYVEKDFKQRTGLDYRMDASLTLYEFTKIAIHCVLEHNAIPVGGYPLENAMITEGIPAIPNQLWNWGIKNRMGALAHHSESKLLFALLPTANAIVTAKGISFLGRNYYAPDVEQRGWFSKARSKGRFKVTISYHPHNLDIILLHDMMHRDKFTVCTLISTDSSDRNLYVEEVLALAIKESKMNGALTFDTLGVKLTHQKAIEDISRSADAAKSAEGPPTRSKKEVISNMRSYRLVEKAMNRISDFSAVNNVETSRKLGNGAASAESKLKSNAHYARIPIFDDDNS
jgi:hypothetical protein